MAGEIFISYRRSDQAWARLLHQQLREEGVEAWYDAHVEAGEDWRVATAKALEDSKIFVLLFSENAAQSSDIAKELAAAVLEKKHIVPIRLQNIAPKGAFLYELASRNWINAYDNTGPRLAEVAKGLAQMVRTGTRDQSALPFEHKVGAPPNRKPLYWALGAGTAAILAALLLFVVLRLPHDVATTDATASARPAGISIAVLPFLNLSADKSQEFFSDGMTEEITSALAKVPGLAVIGRTSAFQFKGENKDMRAIGEALGAKNLIEGSVRKAGDEVRITVQLIKAADGTHLWTESYDRKLTDIFAVQEDIATAIASALQVPLGLKQGQNLVSSRTGDLDAYQQYLRARALYRARQTDQAVTILKDVVARDPNYAPAWALLAFAYTRPGLSQFQAALRGHFSGQTDAQTARSQVAAIMDDAEKAAREAIRLDPRLAMGYAALAATEATTRRFIASEDHMRVALALDSNDPDMLYDLAADLAAVGRLRDARKIQAQILALEPFVPQYNIQTADVLWALGRNDEAIALLKKLKPQAGVTLGFAKAYAAKGQLNLAADILSSNLPPDPSRRNDLERAAKMLRAGAAQSTARDPDFLPENLLFVYLFSGQQDRLLEYAKHRVALGLSSGLFRNPWAPSSAGLRKTQGFREFVRNSGLLEDWRARGWPDSCHPIGADDFACN